MFKIIKKADIFLFIFLLILGIALSLPGFMQAGQPNKNSVVEIRVSGILYGSFPLEKDAEFFVIQKNGQVYIADDSSDFDDMDRINHIIIKDQKVNMEESTCHNQVCVKQGKISGSHQTIICLPNQLMVEIVANGEAASEGGDPDVITG